MTDVSDEQWDAADVRVSAASRAGHGSNPNSRHCWCGQRYAAHEELNAHLTDAALDEMSVSAGPVREAAAAMLNRGAAAGMSWAELIDVAAGIVR